MKIRNLKNKFQSLFSSQFLYYTPSPIPNFPLSSSHITHPSTNIVILLKKRSYEAYWCFPGLPLNLYMLRGMFTDKLTFIITPMCTSMFTCMFKIMFTNMFTIMFTNMLITPTFTSMLTCMHNYKHTNA